MYPDEIEKLLSVFQGTTTNEEQEKVGVEKSQRRKNTLRSAKGPKMKEKEYRTCQIGVAF